MWRGTSANSDSGVNWSKGPRTSKGKGKGIVAPHSVEEDLSMKWKGINGVPWRAQQCLRTPKNMDTHLNRSKQFLTPNCMSTNQWNAIPQANKLAKNPGP